MMTGSAMARFGDVCSFEKEQRIHSGLPYVGLEHIESGTGKFLGVDDPVKVKSSTFRFSPAHVLYGRLRPYLNKVLLPDFDGHCSTEIFPILPSSRLNRKFLFYWLSMDSTVNALHSTSTGARMPRANMGALLEFKIPVPALDEQRRIVAILDGAFEGMAAVKANAEKNLQNSVDWVSCQLTEILESESKNGSSGALDSLVASDCSLSYGIVQPGEEVSFGLPIVRPVDLGLMVVGLDGLKRIDPALAQSYARTTLKGNDLLLCVRGTTGTVSMADSTLAGANVTRGIVPIRFDPKTILQRFGYYLLRSSPVQHQIRAKTYGAALMQINIGDLRQVSLSFPPLDRQPGLLEKLDAVQESGDRLVMNYQKKLMMFEELKKSLLHQAFTGQL